MHLLIIEEHPATARFIGRGLERGGTTYTIAQNGEAAYAILGRERFDAVLLSMELGDGPPPVEVGRKISSCCPGLPIIAISAGAQDCVAALSAGACDYLSKPLRVRDLSRRVQQAVDRARELQPIARGTAQSRILGRLLAGWPVGQVELASIAASSPQGVQKAARKLAASLKSAGYSLNRETCYRLERRTT